MTGSGLDTYTAIAEDLRVEERLIAAPAAGVFNLPPEAIYTAGEMVHAGQPLGSIGRNVGAVEVVITHTGHWMGFLAYHGERVREGQPLAWVRLVG